MANKVVKQSTVDLGADYRRLPTCQVFGFIQEPKKVDFGKSMTDRVHYLTRSDSIASVLSSTKKVGSSRPDLSYDFADGVDDNRAVPVDRFRNLDSSEVYELQQKASSMSDEAREILRQQQVDNNLTSDVDSPDTASSGDSGE